MLLRGRSLILFIIVLTIVIATWTNLKITQQLVVVEEKSSSSSSSSSSPTHHTHLPPLQHQQLQLQDDVGRNTSQQQSKESKNNNKYNSKNTTTATATATNGSSLLKFQSKILGFTDSAYVEYAIRWYHRLTSLGYTEHVIVTVDMNSTQYIRNLKRSSSSSSSRNGNIRYEELPYKLCISSPNGGGGDKRNYRRQIFGRRWKYVYDQLKEGYSILLTDVDNVFLRYVPLSTYYESKYDVYHAYSTSYPQNVFEDMGFTVCGGMSWLRSNPRVIRFVGTLVNTCKCLKGNTQQELCSSKCYCDDQVVLNELLWKGKHKVTWDYEYNTTTRTKPKSLKDYPWKGITGISQTTQHTIQIWDRSYAYRAPLPDKCPDNNWVAMPLYVDRDIVVDVWDKLCSSSSNQNNISSNK